MTMVVEIFKTNVEQTCQAADIVRQLTQLFPHCRINFDLEDCDRILRIESQNGFINSQQIIKLMMGHGYACIPFA